MTEQSRMTRPERQKKSIGSDAQDDDGTSDARESQSLKPSSRKCSDVSVTFGILWCGSAIRT